MNQNEQKGKVARLVIGFTKYKLTRLMMEQFQDNEAKKLLFKIRLNDLSNPTTMKLWVYPAKNHKQYAESEPGVEVLPYGTSTFSDTNDILIGNNEVALKYFHKENKLNKPWRDFTFITLEPSKKDGDLIFLIRYDDAMVLVGNETNPCPPAKPEET